MQRTGKFQSPLVASDLESQPVFNVVIAYEDFETGNHARKTYDYLAAHLGQDCRFNNEMWKFDVLGVPKLREMAAKDAQSADIVMISCRAGTPLSNEVKSWIESWLSEEVNSIALVALIAPLTDKSPQTKETLAYLADVAKRGNLEFFAQPDRWPVRNPIAETIQLFPTRSSALDENSFLPLADFNSRADKFPHWGIND